MKKEYLNKTCRRFWLLAALTLGAQSVAWAESDPVPPVPTLIEEGDYAGYYAIRSADDLLAFAGMVNSGSGNINAVLMDDIVLNESVLNEDGSLNGTPAREWTPIGTNANAFAGTFDGNGHVVSGLYFDNHLNYNSYPLGGNCIGLIGEAQGATIRNVGLVDSYLKGMFRVAGICALSSNTTISNCYNLATIVNTENVGAGILGEGTNTEVSNCYNAGLIDGSIFQFVGGIAAYLNGGTISNSYNYGTVIGGYYDVHSICGAAYVEVENCYYLSTGVADANAVAKDTAAFASGEVAYLLNGGETEGDLVWGQKIGTDTLPTYGGDVVYRYGTFKCNGVVPVDGGYSNTKGVESVIIPVNDYNEKGISESCNAYLPAQLIEEGDYAGYYAIRNAGNLLWFAETVNSGAGNINAVLMNDIVLNESVLNEDGSLNGTPVYEWTPIGTSSNLFYGAFDGNGHVVSGLYFDNQNPGDYPDGGSQIGLIGKAGGFASIKNVGLVDSYLSGYQYVGGIVGYSSNSYVVISGCYNASTIIASDRYAGGIIGCSYSQKISRCYNVGVVDANYLWASIAGAADGSIEDCFYLSTCAPDEKAVAKDAAAFASGEVAYLLNGGETEGDLVWGQAIGTDPTPRWSGEVVYRYGSFACGGAIMLEGGYSNTPGEVSFAPVEYNENGVSDMCGTGISAQLIEEGEYAGYYAIRNAGNLLWFADTVNGGAGNLKAVLMNDIVLNESVLNEDGSLNGTPAYEWTPIGIEGSSFSGTFDGNGHTVSGLYFSNDFYDVYPKGGNRIGLIGDAYGATIKNVGLVDSYFLGGWQVAGICARAQSTTISNCYNLATIVNTENVGAGILGEGYYTNVSNCYNAGLINGSSRQYVGGIAAYLSGGTIKNSYNYGTVIGGYYDVHSICGAACEEVENCYYLSTGVADANAVAKDTAAFASGEVAYLLNVDSVWYQTIDGDTPDLLPTLNMAHKVVFYEDETSTYYNALPIFAISYDLDGGNMADGNENPTSYTVASEDIVLLNPVKENCEFLGWYGTELDEPSLNVVIPSGSIGDRSYVAVWQPSVPTAVDAPVAQQDKGDVWHTLSGVVLRGRPSVPGLYVHNGKLESVK